MMLLIGLPLPVMKSVYYYDTEAARARDAALLSPETLPATATAVPPANFAGYSLEDLYYMQQPKLWGLMEALQRQRPGTVDLYYLGFAASSGADVYRREVQAARQLMDERFDTAGRSLLLVNDHDTLHELPIASASGLAWALGWLTSIMDVEEDVLFLHLAAEAAEDALTPDLPPLPMDGLTAARLKSMLDGEGYKWRVVVVSACRIGTFAEALADDNTLVLAAAGNGRSAGGCEAGQDFTGFGRAYFDRGLRQERSFLRAFDVAREIADREHGAAGYPQAYAGNAIRARLGALEARLAN
jgi:hypothetical protein